MGSLICGTAIPWRRYVSVPRSVGAVNLWNFKKQNTYDLISLEVIFKIRHLGDLNLHDTTYGRL